MASVFEDFLAFFFDQLQLSLENINIEYRIPKSVSHLFQTADTCFIGVVSVRRRLVYSQKRQK